MVAELLLLLRVVGLPRKEHQTRTETAQEREGAAENGMAVVLRNNGSRGTSVRTQRRHTYSQ